MGRIRTIKPEFFTHWELYELEKEFALPLRVAFAGLWTQVDREGRFQWIPQQLKLGCLPYDEVDFSRVLDALSTRDFIRKYVVDGREYGVIPGFLDHQIVNNRERASSLPDPSSDEGLTRAPRVDDASATREVHALAERKGKEGKGKEGDIHPNGCTSPECDLQKPKKKSCPHAEIISVYHETLKPCPQVRDWHATRQGYLRARWNEKEDRQTLDWWKRFFDYVGKSDFLMGRTDGRDGKPPFLADLEWMVKPTNFAKIIEGKYHK